MDGLPDEEEDSGDDAPDAPDVPVWTPSLADNKKRAAVMGPQPVTGTPVEIADQIGLKLTYDNTYLTSGPNWVDGIYQWFPDMIMSVPAVEDIQQSLFYLTSAYLLALKQAGKWEKFGTAIQRVIMINVISQACVQWSRSGDAFTQWLTTHFSVVRDIEKCAFWLNEMSLLGLNESQFAIMNALRIFSQNVDGAFRRELHDNTRRNWHLKFNDELKDWFIQWSTAPSNVLTGTYMSQAADAFGYSYTHEEHYWDIDGAELGFTMPEYMIIDGDHSWELRFDITVNESDDSDGRVFGFRTYDPQDSPTTDVNYKRGNLLPRLWNYAQSFVPSLWDEIPFGSGGYSAYHQPVSQASGTDHDIAAYDDMFSGRQEFSIKCEVVPADGPGAGLCKISYCTVEWSTGNYRLLGCEVLMKSQLHELEIQRFYTYPGLHRIYAVDLF
jgi:hypothetical protein